MKKATMLANKISPTCCQVRHCQGRFANIRFSVFMFPFEIEVSGYDESISEDNSQS